MNASPLLFGTNWKMNKTAAQAREYAVRLSQRLERISDRNSIAVFVIPPYTSLEVVRRAANGRFWVGAQNMHWAESGPYTGEISATMLSELGVDLVEIGHAERRQLYNETDVDVNRKVHTALRFGLRPLICIGEGADDKHFGVELETVTRQLRIALHTVPGESAHRLIIAYEPSWAIGDTGVAADPDYVKRVFVVIRGALESVYGPAVAAIVPVLYGGNVWPNVATDLLVRSRANGLFIGRSALDADDFADLIADCLQRAT